MVGRYTGMMDKIWRGEPINSQDAVVGIEGMSGLGQSAEGMGAAYRGARRLMGSEAQAAPQEQTPQDNIPGGWEQYDPDALPQEGGEQAMARGGKVKSYAGGGLTSAPTYAPPGTGGAMQAPMSWGGNPGSTPSLPSGGTTGQPQQSAGGSYGGINWSRSGYGSPPAAGSGRFSGQAARSSSMPGQQQQQTGKQYGFYNRPMGSGFAEGGEVDELDPTSDRDTVAPNLSAALKTVSEIFKWGYQKHGLGSGNGQRAEQETALPVEDDVQEFAEGDEVEAIEAPPAQAEEALPMASEQPQEAAAPEEGWQAKVRRGFREMPSPAAPLEAPVKRILGLIQGQGAMPTEQALALESGAPSKDPSVAKTQTAHMLAQTQGPEAAWGYMQALRKQYDLHRTNAAVKARKGDLANSTSAATKAMTNVLDGYDTHFSPTSDGKGVHVRIRRAK